VEVNRGCKNRGKLGIRKIFRDRKNEKRKLPKKRPMSNGGGSGHKKSVGKISKDAARGLGKPTGP